MKLKGIKIINYRSIEDLYLEIEDIASSKTFTLLGINESGKSNILKALDLQEQDKISYPLDFFNSSKEIQVNYIYELSSQEQNNFKEALINKQNFDQKLAKRIVIKEYVQSLILEPKPTATLKFIEHLEFTEDIRLLKMEKEVIDAASVLTDTTIEGTVEIKDYILSSLPDYFNELSHTIIFWKSSPKYLITDEIDLQKFAQDPTAVSVPLRNCFALADLNISQEIAKLNDAGCRHNLQAKLGDIVTKHINKVWPEHEIKIIFNINDNKLSFLVEDKNVKYNSKTTNQRSDGFKQFISFLLTLSAENIAKKLENTILLLDEPETHLHPSAQINLKDELIKITQNDNNNIVIFATHSNYMIDKENINRCYKVKKKNNCQTEISRIQKAYTSYSEVNYDVFGIVTTDYHNELYGYLEDIDKSKLDNLKKNKKWINAKTNKTENVSLATYIRHSIHHPENTKNLRFTEKELKQSIDTLKELKENQTIDAKAIKVKVFEKESSPQQA
jgi:predicted ATP-dependent endonuclease of OLD family